MNFPFGPIVTWLQRTTSVRDADGNDTFTWTSVSLPGAAFSPGPSIETVQGQDMIVDKPSLYLPPSASIPSAFDRFLIDGVTYDCDGTPAQWKSPFSGWAPGTVVRLKATSG